MTVPSRWPDDPEHSQWYIERFRKLAADGVDLAGEARLVDAMLPRGSRVLDAGCGEGRVGGELAARGHDVVGVDADPRLIASAGEHRPGPTWLVADLAALGLAELGQPQPFDACVMAGNVMTFLGEGTERAVLTGLHAHLKPDGFAVVGFGTGRGYELDQFDTDLAAAGFTLEHRFATWDLRPFAPTSDFAVTVLRRPGD
ncbi:class I SAM-dependent DNA methyltransferase [Angustibacter sp. McL0619]|uniref:class I SAM-dependent DNA methyltransferase n=1 Tax=Angustibacter sp. McL0619 TaxID=3415676 RepID=UPI003CF941C9